MVRERPVVLASPPGWPPAAPKASVGPLLSVELHGRAPSRVDAEPDAVRPHGVGAVGLHAVDALGRGSGARPNPSAARGRPVDRRAGRRCGVAGAVRRRRVNVHGRARGRAARALEPEHGRLAEGVEGPEHLVALRSAASGSRPRWRTCRSRSGPRTASRLSLLARRRGVTRKSLKLANQVPSQLKPPARGAVVERGRGGGAGAGAGAVVGAVARMGSAAGGGSEVVPVGRDGPVEDGLLAPSTRRFTVTGSGRAPLRARPARAGGARRAERARKRLRHRATLSTRVVWAGRSQVSWLGAPRRAFPGGRRLPSGVMRRLSARSQWRDRAGLHTGLPSTTGR